MKYLIFFLISINCYASDFECKFKDSSSTLTGRQIKIAKEYKDKILNDLAKTVAPNEKAPKATQAIYLQICKMKDSDLYDMKMMQDDPKYMDKKMKKLKGELKKAEKELESFSEEEIKKAGQDESKPGDMTKN